MAEKAKSRTRIAHVSDRRLGSEIRKRCTIDDEVEMFVISKCNVRVNLLPVHIYIHSCEFILVAHKWS